MDSQFFMKPDDTKKEQNKYRGIYYFDKYIINVNNENFLKDYQNYLKNINKTFIHTRHHIFNSNSQNDLKGILSSCGSSILTKEFEQKIVRSHNFKLELLENFKMSKEDKYLRILLKIESRIRNHKLRQNYNIKMKKLLYERNIRTYKNYQKHKLEKEHSEKRKKIYNIIKYFINAAFKLRNIEVNFGDNFFYDNLFFLENLFFIKKIKNMDEVLQNNEFKNEIYYAITNHDKFEKKLKDYNAHKKYSYNYNISFNFLKSLKIDRFFLLDLQNIYEEKDYSIKKIGYLHLLEYLNNQGIWSFVNNRVLNNGKLDVKFKKYYSHYKRKILEHIEHIDFKYVEEKMGDKYFHVSHKENIKKKIKELNILKFLILKTFRQCFNKKKFNRKYKYPLRIVITGKIKKEIKQLAKYLKKAFSLKIYDFNNLKKEVDNICSMKNTKKDLCEDVNKNNFMIKKKRKILKKLRDIARKLDEKNIDKNTCDNLYVDLLYYRIKYDYDKFYLKENNFNVTNLKNEKDTKKIKNNRMNKSPKYRGYIIINFFFSIKQYILFELKTNKLFLYNHFIYEHIQNLQNINLSINKKKKKYTNKFQIPSYSKCTDNGIPKNIEIKNYEKSDNKHLKEIKNEENGNKILSCRKENMGSKKELDSKKNLSIEDMDNFTERNILFFSNFFCKIEDFFYTKNNILGGIDLHFHIDRCMKQITDIVFRLTNRYSSRHLQGEGNNNNIENKHDKEHILKFRKRKRKIMRVTDTTQLFHSKICKSSFKVTCKIKKSYKTLTDKIKKDINCDSLSDEIFNENKKKKFSNFHLIKNFFNFDENYKEIENFLKSYKSSKYPRYHILKNDIYRSSNNFISKIISLIEKDKVKHNKKKNKKNSNTERKISKSLNKKETDINNISTLIEDIKINKNVTHYFKLRYCNIIKVYITHLFNFFVWKRILEKNINKVIKYVHKNIYIFIDFTNIEDINKFIQLYNSFEEFEIANEQVKLLLFEKLNIIQKRVWLEILKQKNNGNEKEKIYLNKWIDTQVFLLIFQNFYLINTEHQLYLNLDYFVNEFLHALMLNDVIFKNENNMLIFNYFPKNKKELYICDNNNYYFPFLNYIKRDINNFLIETCEYKKNLYKVKNSGSCHSDSFYSQKEKKLFSLVKEFRSINNCRFFYKLHELVNYSTINLRKYFFIFQDLNNYINKFITLHYLCVYKHINFLFDQLRNFIQNSKHIPFSFVSMFNIRKFNFDEKYNKLKELKYENINLEDKNNENKSTFYEEKRKKSIRNNVKIKKKEKTSKEKYRYSYFKNSSVNNLIKYNNNNENKLFFKKNYIYIFLKNVLNYIFITQNFPVISKLDLRNFIISSLFFIKGKSEKICTYILFNKILDAYSTKYNITGSFFILPKSMINNINCICTPSLQNNKEGNQSIFILHFIFFLLFFFFSKPKKGYIKKIFLKYLDILDRKMDKVLVNKSVKKEIFKKGFFLFDDLSNETKNTTNNIEIKTEDLENKNMHENNNYCTNQFENHIEIKKNNENLIKEENNIDNLETYVYLDNMEYFTFKEFVQLGLFNFIKNKKKSKEDKKILDYEITLLNKFIFNYFFSFSEFPNFHENIQIYIKDYLLKINNTLFSLYEEVVRKKIQNIDKVNSQLVKNNKKEKEKNVEINQKIDNLKNKKKSSLILFNAKKKVMAKEILIFFHSNYYDFNLKKKQ